MNDLMRLVLFVAIGLVFAVVLEWARLRKFWARVCTGRLWKRRFPRATKNEIREFLDLFVEAFAFSRSRRLCFSPDDRVLDVYRALYPFPKLVGDAMEMETFAETASERYGVDLLQSWRKDITLGDLFERTRRPVA